MPCMSCARIKSEVLIKQNYFNHSTLWAYSADDKLIKFFLFFQKTGFGISCKLSPLETICMKCQILFSWKNKKNISKCRLLKILPRVPPVVVSADCSKVVLLLQFFSLCMPVIATAIVSCHCLFLNSSSCGASGKTAS